MTMKQRRTLDPFTDEHEALSSMSKTRRPACDDEASGAVKNNSFVIRLLGVVEKVFYSERISNGRINKWF